MFKTLVLYGVFVLLLGIALLSCTKDQTVQSPQSAPETTTVAVHDTVRDTVVVKPPSPHHKK